jgi:hypothetical protein
MSSAAGELMVHADRGARRALPALAAPKLALLVAALWIVGTVVGVAPAAGHASGELPHARLSSSGTLVDIELTMAADDAALIGEVVGQLQDGAMASYLGGPIEAMPTDDEVRTFSASSELRAYLLEHVAVRQDGQPCDGTADPAEDFLTDGAIVRFRCPSVVTEADVRITLLHDEDPAYRTYSVDGTIQYAVHSPSEPEHRWDFTLAKQEGGGSVPVALWAGLVGVTVPMVAILGRRRRRTAQAAR